MNVENRVVRLAELEGHPRNYNRHSAAQIERLRASLRRYQAVGGQVRSIVVHEVAQSGGLRYRIIAGHGIVAAARLEGFTELRADVLPAGMSEAEALAYLAADNELARLGDPDEAMLAGIVIELGDVDAELAALAAGTEERLRELVKFAGSRLQEDPGAQVDRAEELREKWQVKPGQLWELGAHRLVCGDCTDGAVVAKVMGGEKADFFVSDPPYVLQAASDKASKADANDQALRHFLRDCWLAVLPYMKSHAGAVWFCNWRTVDCVRTATMTRNEKNYQAAVWYKGKGATPGSPWMNTVEMLLFYCLDNYNHKKATGLDNHVSIAWNGGVRANHPAEKPVEVYEYALTPMFDGDLVVDPFCGSGTTLIACEKLGRRCRAVEISPAYCAVALERWAGMTGKTPVLLAGTAQGEVATDKGDQQHGDE